MEPARNAAVARFPFLCKGKASIYRPRLGRSFEFAHKQSQLRGTSVRPQKQEPLRAARLVHKRVVAPARHGGDRGGAASAAARTSGLVAAGSQPARLHLLRDLGHRGLLAAANWNTALEGECSPTCALATLLTDITLKSPELPRPAQFEAEVKHDVEQII
jgi:hypothetical protein